MAELLQPIVKPIQDALAQITTIFTNIYNAIVSFVNTVGGFFAWLGAVISQGWQAFSEWMANIPNAIASWLMERLVNPLASYINNLVSWLFPTIENMIRGVECAFSGAFATLRRKFVKIAQYNFTVLFLRDAFRSWLRGGVGGIISSVLGMLFSPFAATIAAFVLDTLLPAPDTSKCLELMPPMRESTAYSPQPQAPAAPAPEPSQVIVATPVNADMTLYSVSDTSEVISKSMTAVDNTTSTFTE